MNMLSKNIDTKHYTPPPSIPSFSAFLCPKQLIYVIKSIRSCGFLHL